jgi:hypothetical protein
LADEAILGGFSEMTTVDHGHEKTQLTEGGQIFHGAILIASADFCNSYFSFQSINWRHYVDVNGLRSQQDPGLN